MEDTVDAHDHASVKGFRKEVQVLPQRQFRGPMQPHSVAVTTLVIRR